MLNINILMCLLNFLFIFNNYNINTISPFQALKENIVKNNIIEMVQLNTENKSDTKNNIEIIETPITEEDEIFKEKELQENLEKDIRKKRSKNLNIKSSYSLFIPLLNLKIVAQAQLHVKTNLYHQEV